jgi:nitroimidazol reductase NimA-like FMN-containing flavoprotein (pyridoxamine 5'-phosphate oxidase superfamily)
MPYRELSSDEVDAVLSSLRIVRVGFFAARERYVIPLGFTWFGSALWGTTSRGRKTSLVATDPHVAFAIDDGIPFETRSVVGEGRFETATLDEVTPVLPSMTARFPDNPPWNIQLFRAGLADGTSLFWRIKPSKLVGRVYFAPPESR